jgi:hypothetical protein
VGTSPRRYWLLYAEKSSSNKLSLEQGELSL